MNTPLLIRHIERYKKWRADHRAQYEQERQEQQAMIRMYRSYSREKILSMTEEDLYEYIAPLWAMLIWGNKSYVIDKLISDNTLSELREQLANLLWGTDTLSKRWDKFRKEIKGIGVAMMSELLTKTHPQDYLVWNRRTLVSFDYLGVDGLPRYDYKLTGKVYASLCEQGQAIRRVMCEQGFENADMLSVNYFMWQELQVQPVLNHLNLGTGQSQEEVVSTVPREAVFIHNDVRDKIAEIGSWLGFQADVEKKVAAGAVVDAVWEVTIGNMGRVIYVFEVQTSGSIDSLILNLMKAKSNKAVQGIIAVTDSQQIEKIKREVAALPICNEVKFWDYTEVLKVHESLSYVNESINRLGLVPEGL